MYSWFQAQADYSLERVIDQLHNGKDIQGTYRLQLCMSNIQFFDKFGGVILPLRRALYNKALCVITDNQIHGLVRSIPKVAKRYITIKCFKGTSPQVGYRITRRCYHRQTLLWFEHPAGILQSLSTIKGPRIIVVPLYYSVMIQVPLPHITDVT